MNLESLYPLLTEAIRRAEDLEDRRAPGARLAHLKVSLLEEEIAEALPASGPEGLLARRGAIRSALAAREPARAQQLVERYLAETEGDEGLRTKLLQPLVQADCSIADRFPKL